jgi:predicted ribosome-associated RNA-binding protein Tma20
VLVAPLNWGLGHATRCIPVIEALIQAGKQVVIAADGTPLLFLQKKFPKLKTIELKIINISYSSHNSQVTAIIKQIPYIIISNIKEHFKLKKIVKHYDIQCIISDNRFLFFCKKTRNIYITHQIGVKIGKNMRILNNFIYHLHKLIINKYDECWIPDFADKADNLSGDLSHKYPLPKNTHFIGVLSRFNNHNV